MYQKVRAGLLTAAVVLAIGCSQSPVAPSPTPAAQSGGPTTVSAMPGGANTPYGMKGEDVPFSGVVTGEAAFDFAANPKGCDAGFTTITTAKGQATHMGLTTWQSQHCLGTENEFLGAGLTLTAANGDKIYATYTGSCPELVGGSVICSGNLEFTGGTGRFTNASGTATLSAAIVFEGFDDFSWPGRWEWTGKINY